MTGAQLQWYWRRARRMSPSEVVQRAGEHARRQAWRRRQVRQDAVLSVVHTGVQSRFVPRLPPDAASSISESAVSAVVGAADRVLDGRWDVLGVRRTDIAGPDWFLDPISGRRAPDNAYAFDIDHRSEEEVGNVKQVWELSRHHHLTVLAAAWFLTRDERYAVVVDQQLRSWWRQNPFLSGIHWTSGLELGVRLISWTWIRRLMDGWPGILSLFEENEAAIRQLRWHHEYLATFRSIGSSANNHVIGEAAGQFVAACAFPWFPESDRWRREASDLLESELERNTFPSGINRELASDYHRFVAELGLVAAAEGEAAGNPLSDATWARLCRMLDSTAAIVDVGCRGPRQGDGDDGRALLLDDPAGNPWASLLELGARRFGRLSWWPSTVCVDVRSTLVTAMTGSVKETADRPPGRPSHFADAGTTLLRTAAKDPSEIWCRCDGGPHGFLSIAAHAHADALSVEVRHGGVDILADPGTYCYHGEPAWRGYFRSTLGHNTLSLEGIDQSTPGGAFLWTSQATTRVLEAIVDEDAPVASWCAEHDGYGRLRPPVRHRRTVRLHRECRHLTIEDRVSGAGHHTCWLAFHLGPCVTATLVDAVAHLEWSTNGDVVTAALRLPETLRWSLHRGERDPILGWYSSGFGGRQAAVTFLGSGDCGPEDTVLLTRLELDG